MIRLKEKIVSSILVTCILVSLFPIDVYAQQTQESSLSENTIAMNVTNEEDGQVMVTEGVVNLGKTVAEVGKNTSSTSSAYASSWEYWSQGASKYSNGDNGLRESGCRIVAYSKALREAGFSNLANPDVFYEWGKAKDYYTGTSVYENASYGVPLITYAQENGGQCALIEKYTLTGNLSTDSAKIMGYINAGYYVILNSPTGYGFHTAYIGRQASIAQGKPVVLDSWSSKSSSANLVYTYTGKTSGSNVAYTACRAYKITPPSYVSSDTTPPTISNVWITDHNNTGYTVNCTVTDNVGVSVVRMPSWTWANDQDDLKDWSNYTATASGTTYSFRVNRSEHNNEGGWYFTHIYAYDAAGNHTVGHSADNGKVYVDITPPTVVNATLSNVTKDGYTLTCTVTDDTGVNRVQFPTWTDYNGSDDIIADWGTSTKCKGIYLGNNQYSFTVNRSEHNNEMGNYTTHIYVYDNYGNQVGCAGVISLNLMGNAVNLGNSFEATIQNAATHTYVTNDDNNVSGRAQNDKSNQKWKFERLEDGSYKIISSFTGCALDCWGEAKNETNIATSPYHGGDNQRWYLYQANQGSYYILPKNSNGCGMDLHYGSSEEGTNIKMYLIYGGGSQQWIIQSPDIISNPSTSTDKNNTNSGVTNNTNTNQNNVTSTNTPQVKNFVKRMYTVALNREAEAAGLNDWSSQLAEQKIDGAGIANGFINSAEFTNRNLGNREFLDTLYETFFNRTADAGGKAYWMQQLSNGMSRTEVLSGFVNSQEFSNLCDNYGIARGTMQPNGISIYRPGVRNYVLRMYTKALNRTGETVGVEDWTNRINTGTMSAENVAKSFFSSQEFINRNLSNSAYVETLYQTFMDRPSDASGKQYWIDKLNSGMSREQVLEGFSRSREFARIMWSYGL